MLLRARGAWVALCAIVALMIGELATAQATRPRAAAGPRRTASIAGRIIHADGTAAEGARVAVYAVRDGVAAAIAGTATSSYDGRYEVKGLAADEYMVGVTAMGPLVGIAATDVSVGPVEDVRVMLRTPGSMEGRIVIDAAAAKASPRPALRVSPRQLLVELSPLYPVEETAAADDGRFTLRELGGECAIVVHGLPDGWRIKRIQHNGAPLPANRIVVPPGERVTGVEVVVGVGTT
jgi:hypothetical protein